MPTTSSRSSAQLQELGLELTRSASLLSRVMFRRAGGRDLTRSEAGVLSALEDGPKRITMLAGLEGLAQPTITALVNRLESRGWVAREPGADDARVVLVSLTDAGHAELETLRERIYDQLRDHLATLSDAELAALESAVSALRHLVTSLQDDLS
jgi:DNA-binding MarR family transcriptional regulator